MIRILVDSSADYTLDEYKKKQIEFVSLLINYEEHSYRDVIDITQDELYRRLAENGELPKTSQPSPQDFLDIFEDVKAKGDSMVVILLSSLLSGTYQSACLAQKMCEYDRIYIIDSLSATIGIQLLAEHAYLLKAQGVEADAIAAELEALKSRICICAAVDTLEYLRRGGRIGKAAAMVGELANLKPIIAIQDGVVNAIGKALGRNKAISSILKFTSQHPIDTDYPIYTVYSYGEESVTKLEEKLNASGITPDDRLQIGASIGVHVGPGAYGIIYIAK